MNFLALTVDSRLLELNLATTGPKPYLPGKLLTLKIAKMAGTESLAPARSLMAAKMAGTECLEPARTLNATIVAGTRSLQCCVEGSTDRHRYQAVLHPYNMRGSGKLGWWQLSRCWRYHPASSGPGGRLRIILLVIIHQLTGLPAIHQRY